MSFRKEKNEKKISFCSHAYHFWCSSFFTVNWIYHLVSYSYKACLLAINSLSLCLSENGFIFS